MTTFTAAELAREAQRELHLRQFRYSKQIDEGKLTPHDAERKISMMEAIQDHFQKLADKRESRWL
jgi:hypothetical protein